MKNLEVRVAKKDEQIRKAAEQSADAMAALLKGSHDQLEAAQRGHETEKGEMKAQVADTERDLALRLAVAACLLRRLACHLERRNHGRAKRQGVLQLLGRDAHGFVRGAHIHFAHVRHKVAARASEGAVLNNGAVRIDLGGNLVRLLLGHSHV